MNIQLTPEWYIQDDQQGGFRLQNTEFKVVNLDSLNVWVGDCHYRFDPSPGDDAEPGSAGYVTNTGYFKQCDFVTAVMNEFRYYADAAEKFRICVVHGWTVTTYDDGEHECLPFHPSLKSPTT